jgi:endoglucanase
MLQAQIPAPATPSQPAQPAHKPPPTPNVPAPTPIRVNSIGFLPSSEKQATVAVPCADFKVLAADSGAVVFSGQAGPLFRTVVTDTDESVQILDFSALTTPGRYVLDIPGAGRSAPFSIGEDVWNEAYRTVTRAMYFWRCGIEVNASWDGKTYHQDPCHLGDGLLDYVGGPKGKQKQSIGGWHDAGDYNKYVVNAGVTVGLMFKAWEQFRDRIEAISIGIPESGKGMPDLLAELRFEFDWLFTMQTEDGSVYHKLSALDFNYWGPPDKDATPRYFSPWGSTATADFVAMMALGARHFREFDAAYADRCLAAARKSYAFLQAHPEYHAADLNGFQTGAYHAKDDVHRLWASMELWETTGDEAFLRDFETRAAVQEFTTAGPDWGDVRDLALGSYLLASRSSARDAKLVARLEPNLQAVADKIVRTCRANAHGRPFGTDRKSFFWGCNGSVAAQAYMLQVADRLNPNPEYRETVLKALGYLFGRNYHARSYVTGLGANPAAHTHDRRGEPQLPGYLVGGPWPTAKHWYDDWKDPSRNEIAINWNASLIYALAAFVDPTAKR